MSQRKQRRIDKRAAAKEQYKAKRLEEFKAKHPSDWWWRLNLKSDIEMAYESRFYEAMKHGYEYQKAKENFK